MKPRFLAQQKVKKNPLNSRRLLPVKLENLLNRPADASERIALTMNSTNCLKCGKCCRVKGLTVFFDEPHFLDFKRSLRLFGVPSDAIYNNRNGITVYFLDGRCYFLEESSNSCLIYAKRPTTCRIYPFILLYRGSADGSIIGMSLNAKCPPVAELNTFGIKVLFYPDFYLPIDRIMDNPERFYPPEAIKKALDSCKGAGRKGLSYLKVKILGSALDAVCMARAKGEVGLVVLDESGTDSPFFTHDDIVFFPILD